MPVARLQGLNQAARSSATYFNLQNSKYSRPVFKYSVKWGLNFFRTDILTLQNKDDSLVLHSLLIINQKTLTSLTHSYHEEIWASEVTRTMNSTFSPGTQAARQFHSRYITCLLLLQEGTSTSLHPYLAEASPGKETRPSPKWKKHTGERAGVTLCQLLASVNKETSKQVSRTARWSRGGRRV